MLRRNVPPATLVSLDMKMVPALVIVTALSLAVVLPSPAPADEMPGMSMASGPMSHMSMTSLRPPVTGDRERAATIVAEAKTVMERYTDVATATRDGYAKFLPTIELPMEHFTNYAYARATLGGHLDPAHPTSLIYARRGSHLQLVGVMYTADRAASEDRLNAMVPLSVAQWHRHVKYCFPAAGSQGDARFGLGGSIDTQAACESAGGRWTPQLFGWMVHVWPLEKNSKAQWSVDHPGDDKHAM